MSTRQKPCLDQKGNNVKKSSVKAEGCMEGKPYELVKLLVISMRLFGLLFLNTQKNKWSPVTRAYSIFVLILLWGSVLHLFFAYKDEIFGAAFFFKIVTHLWFVHCCVNATVTYKASDSEDRLVEFLLKWSRLLETNRGSSPEDPGLCPLKYAGYMRRSFNGYLLISWIIMVSNCAFNAYILFETNMGDFTLTPVRPNSPNVTVIKVLVTVLHIYRSAAWIFTPTLFLFMSAIIYKEFETFHSDLRKGISPDGDMADLEWFRRRHQDICHLVETADDVLSAFNAAGILFRLCDGMLIVYSMFWYPDVKANALVLAAHFFWLGLSLLYLVLIAYGGGYLNHMAHSPLKTIHDIKLKDVSPAFSLQMTVFINKLTGESIGLTALDMFVIDKPTILTIAGAFVTYFVVLIQSGNTTNRLRPASVIVRNASSTPLFMVWLTVTEMELVLTGGLQQ